MLQKTADAVSYIGHVVYIKGSLYIMSQQIFPLTGKLLFQCQRLDRSCPRDGFHQK